MIVPMLMVRVIARLVMGVVMATAWPVDVALGSIGGQELGAFFGQVAIGVGLKDIHAGQHAKSG